MFDKLREKRGGQEELIHPNETQTDIRTGQILEKMSLLPSEATGGLFLAEPRPEREGLDQCTVGRYLASKLINSSLNR